MWCERVVRHVGDPQACDWGDKTVDFVDVAWNALGRVLKGTTRAGAAVRVLLAPGQRLRHGDVIFEDERMAVVVDVLPCEVIVARPADAAAAAKLGLALGNLHWPTQVGDGGELVFVEDGLVMAEVEKLGIGWGREVRRFEPAASGMAVRLAGEFSVVRGKPTR